MTPINHHYVAEWFQKEFVEDRAQPFLFSYEKKPARIEGAQGKRYPNVSRRPTSKLFCKDHLYTFKGSTVLETKFYGDIDSRGRNAFAWITNYCQGKWVDHGNAFCDFLTAQYHRTPRRLNLARSWREDRNRTPTFVSSYEVVHRHSLSRCVWEIVDAPEGSNFILSDNPVTLFNDRHRDKNDSFLFLHGRTRVIMPLSKGKCLIITPFELVIDGWYNDQKVNPRGTHFSGLQIPEFQYDRVLTQDEVERINYIIWERADRFVASPSKENLKPSRNFIWRDLDRDWFLMPNPNIVRILTQEATLFVECHTIDGQKIHADRHGFGPHERGFRDRARCKREDEAIKITGNRWLELRGQKSQGRRLGRNTSDPYDPIVIR